MPQIAVLLACVAALVAVEPQIKRHHVSVTLSIERDAGGPVLVGRFVPDATEQPPLHLYAIDLVGDKGGIPTRLELPADAPVQARAALSADQPTRLLDGLSVYPDGQAVTLRLPITEPAQAGELRVLVTYMACSAETCMPPVRKAPVTLAIAPGMGAPAAPAPVAQAAPMPGPEPVEQKPASAPATATGSSGAAPAAP